MQTIKKVSAVVLSFAMMLTAVSSFIPRSVQAAEFSGSLTTAESAKANGNIVEISFNGGAVKAKITFLEDDIFRYNVDPSGEFSEYARINNQKDTAKITQYPDSSSEYAHPNASVSDESNYLVISSGNTTIKIEKSTAKMTVLYKNEVIMQESAPLSIGSKTTQSLVKQNGANYYGGGTQNGRFVHTGEKINIANESNWVDGGVASPNPFYYSTEGYGVLRNTFIPGSYDFGNTVEDTVLTSHNENEFDAYYFLSDGGNDVQEVVQDVLKGYFHVTGNPVLLPEYAFYEGHLNCYNRDSWVDTNGTGGWIIKGSSSSSGDDTVPIASAYKEAGMSSGYVLEDGMNAETLIGERPTVSADKFPSTVTTEKKFSASAVIDQYADYDMPLGYFLPNDGYGCGYGQNGYYQTGGVNPDGTSSDERIAAVDANVRNLQKFTEYARSKGVETGLWTQSNLSPDSNSNTSWHLLRDFKKEVNDGGITTLKTDVAWVGSGYNFALNGIKTAYDIVTSDVNYRPNIITLDGWAGTQRFGAIWTGDQYGGNWEYIRFHIPTYIGQSLSGNPNIGSDTDGIFGGNVIISVRDTQWKVFTPEMLNMDGWGSYAKTPQTFGDPYTGISRMYLKLKAQLLPYIYTSAASASNIDTGNQDTGLPMIRAMFLEYPNDAYASTKAMQYQYMFGSNFLVAPVYTETDMKDEVGNDVRNGIYLPDENEIWIDYFTGDQYYGGQVLNGFDVPIWKLPVFVKNGSIVPMWEENNSPSKINKQNRIVEFWPSGTSEYTLFEDNGTYVKNETQEVEGYGTVSNISYGDHVSTKYTSVVNDGTAVLTAEKSTGTYAGYNQNKNTTFVVNVSEEPTNIIAKNGDAVLTKIVKDSKEEVLNADVAPGTYVYYYDANPAIETYGIEVEDEFAKMMEDKTSSPKLYVKFAEIDSQANAQTLTLEGFKNEDSKLGKNELNNNLSVPTNLTDDEDRKTPTSNTLTWNAVADATNYEILVDGVVNTVGNATEFTHLDQDYNSTHTYKVRARNAEGYSDWSEEVSATTAQDPWRNVPDADITWTGGDQWGALSNATDHNLSTQFHSTGDVVTDAIPFIFDYGDAYSLDKFEYYARHDNYGNGAVKRMAISVSMDGVHWKDVYETPEDQKWSYVASASQEENKKTVDLGGVNARYVKLVVKESVGNFFSADELIVYKKDGTKAFAVGSTNGQATVTDADYTNMKNYLGLSKTVENDTFIKQIQERGGDINVNDMYDVYDYAFTMFKLDGGTSKAGNVSGNILLLPSLSEVKSGETFTISVYADNVKNLNAFGEVLEYDPAKLEYVSTVADFDISQMENLTVNKITDDKTSAYVTLAFVNRGNKLLYNGTGAITTITMKAKSDGKVSDMMDLSKVTLMGPKFDFIVSERKMNPEPPEITTGETEYVYNTDFTLTMTNDLLTSDDGTNVSKLIQENQYDGLFDNSYSRDFAFKWDIESNHTKDLPEYVKLPSTITLEMKDTGKDVTSIKVYNANKNNGYLTKASAVFYYADSTSQDVAEITADNSDYYTFVFANPSPAKKVVKVDINMKESTGTTHSGQNNKMLTLSEIEIYNGETKLTYKNDFAASITNESLPTDDGTNVSKLVQSNSFDGLFNGNTQERDFEFKWDIENNYITTGQLPDYVKLPSVLHINLNNAKRLDNVSIFNANKANGYVTKAAAIYHYENGDSANVDEITADMSDNFEFKFVNPNPSKNVISVDVKINQAIDTNGDEVNNMMTLSEMKVRYIADLVPVTGIVPAESNATEIYCGSLVDINAVITPDNATNPYFTAVSSDEKVARVITLLDENGLPVHKLYGISEGKTTITLTANESIDSDTPIRATYEVTVLKGADKTELIQLIQKCGNIIEKYYTAESYEKLELAINKATEIKNKADATTNEVKQAIKDLNIALDQLEELPLSEIMNKSGFTADALYSDNNSPNLLIDGNVDTYWESPYFGSDAGLPKDVVIQLGNAYDLDKISIVKSGAMNGKVLQYEILVSTDGEEYTSIGVKNTDADELESGMIVGMKQITHVKIRVHKAMHTDGTDSASYARIAEVKFYGIDKTVLSSLVKENENKTQENYTDESWTHFTNALNAAKKVLADENASQSDVDAMIVTLNDAIAGLKEKDPTTPDKGEIQVGEKDPANISAILDSIDDKLQAIIDEKLNEGKDVQINIIVDELTEANMSEGQKADRTRIEEFVKKNQGNVGGYFDISIQVECEGSLLGTITETVKPLQMQLTIPEGLKKEGRTFTVVRVHNGSVEELTTTQQEDVLSFETDKFSVYSITYKDGAPSDPTQPGGADTGDHSMIPVFIGLLSSSFIAILLMIKKSKKKVD